MGKRSASIFTDFVFFIAIPAMLLGQFSSQSLEKLFNGPFIAAFILSCLVIGGLTLLFSKRTFPNNLSERAISLIGTAQINTTYLAIPVFFLFFKNVAPIVLVMVFQTIFLTPLSIAILEYDIYRKAQPTQGVATAMKLFLKHLPLILMKAPVVPAAMIGVALSYYQIPVAASLKHIFDVAGSMAAPLSLFVLGLSLEQDRIDFTKDDLLIDLLGLTLLKNLMHPLVAFFIGRYIFDLEPFWMLSLCLLSAMPAARNASLFAQRYGLNVRRTNALILITTFISFITIGLILTFFKDQLQMFVQ